METAAAQTTATQAPAAAPPAAVELTGDPIFDALAQHTPEEEPSESTSTDAETTTETTETKADPTKEEQKPEPEKPEGEKPDAKARRKALESELFSEKALATPEGVQKAREYVQARQSKLDGIGQRIGEERAQLKSERETLVKAYNEAKAEIDGHRAVAQRLVKELERLNNPASTEEFLEALGAIAGRPGIEIWEQGARFMVNGGKRPAPSREVEQLRSQLATLERKLAERDETAESQTLEQETARAREFVERRTAEITEAAKDATKYPELAKHARMGMAPNIVAEVASMKRAAKAKGQRLGDGEALAIIEGELKKLTASGARAPASPAEANSADARVSSIAPSMTRSAGSQREKTEAELAEDLAKDTAALSAILGTQVG